MKFHDSLVIAVLALSLRALFTQLWPDLVANGILIAAIALMVWITEVV